MDKELGAVIKDVVEDPKLTFEEKCDKITQAAYSLVATTAFDALVNWYRAPGALADEHANEVVDQWRSDLHSANKPMLLPGYPAASYPERIKRWVWKLVFDRSKYIKRHRSKQATGGPEEVVAKLEHPSASAYEFMIEQERLAALWECFSTVLDDREQELAAYEMDQGSHKTTEQLAQLLKVSKKTVYNRRQKVLTKLRNCLASKGYDSHE